METKRNSQLLVPLILLSVLFSQTWALTALDEEALRNVRHADGVSTSDISSLLDDNLPKDYTESLMEKRLSDDISEDLGPSKRSDEEAACSACLASIDKYLKEHPESKKRNAYESER